MKWEYSYTKAIEQINVYQKEGINFFFALDFEKNSGIVVPLHKILESPVKYSFHSQSNLQWKQKIFINKSPVSFEIFKGKFKKILNHIENGNSYLCNLCFQTPIQSSISLEDIFTYAQAPYKFIYQNKFTVFSPERFIRIHDNTITTNPMKGTILAEIPNAEAMLQSNQKEIYEHNTIVDLLRNDLSIVADKVKVTRLQYLEKIKTNNNTLIQMSSEIQGHVKKMYQNEFGTLLDKVLPAGSICGAPKLKTCEIIKDTEAIIRNYYTGVFGECKDNTLDCAVAIRFIEKVDNQYYFRSGGGITSMSIAKDEYEEMLNKIYVPIY
ncbi:MAG: aminodeoxychorismate synthase component I [Saprospiraceae bacterium]|nr:aminodeoxychorismate synthase component I [Saprospiraceae bacterium]